MCLPTIDAAGRMQVAVQMNHILAASAFMKVINILSHCGQLWHMFGTLSDSEVSTVWLRLENLLPTPFVLPQQSGGSALNTSLVASSAGSKRFYSPVNSTLNVGMPLSADAPASVKNMTC